MEIQIKWGVQVPMRDGIKLAADIYRPKGEGKVPAIVIRTPYGRLTEPAIDNGKYYASHGYAVVYMDVRGRGDSEGEFVPYRNEGIDGYDSIEWVAAQDWCDGNVGTFGGSYLGRIQWLTALHNPPHLKAMISTVAPSDPFVENPTGSPTPHHLCWLWMTSGRVVQPMHHIDWDSIYKHLPLVTMDELTGREIPYWREEMKHTRLDEWWKHICYQNQFDKINVPVLNVSGWYDDEQIGTPLNYYGMTNGAATEWARKNQKLLMGPWGHNVNASQKVGDVDFGPDAVIDLRGCHVRFFDRWLKNEANGIDEEPNVRIFVMGDNKWRDEPDWPLPGTQWTKYYLHSEGGANSSSGDGRLSTDAPAAASGEPGAADRYIYDPGDPFPFITEGTSSQIGGPDDYAEAHRRSDVLIYDTPVLTADTEVTGPVKMELFASSTAVDTDFAVKLLDVRPDGVVQRLCDGFVRARFREGMEQEVFLEPGRAYKYEIDCWNTSHVFKKGHQIRVEISSAAFPKVEPNLNTGAPLGMTSDYVTAEQTVHHDAAHPSAIILPIIPR